MQESRQYKGKGKKRDVTKTIVQQEQVMRYHSPFSGYTWTQIFQGWLVLGIMFFAALLIAGSGLGTAIAALRRREDESADLAVFTPQNAQPRHGLRFFKEPVVRNDDTCPKSEYIIKSLKSTEMATKVESCQTLTAEYVENFIIGSPSTEITKKMTQAILETQALDPHTRNYMMIVFNNLPQFKILLASEAECNQHNFGAAYSSTKRVLILNYQADDHSLKVSILHEFRHALMNTIHIHQAKSGISSSAYCYSPMTPSESNKIASYFVKGFERIENIRKMLNLETAGKLNKSQKKSLQKLRVLFNDSYNSFSLFLAGTDSGLEKTSDSLQYLASVTIEINKYVEKEYPKDKYLYELEAHFFGYLPVPMIKEIFPELYENGQKLIARLPGNPKSLQIDNGIKMPLDKYANYELADIVELCKNDEFTQVELEKILIFASRWITKKIHYKHAETALQTLINKDYKVLACHQLLGELYHAAENYPEACKHFDVVFKQRITPETIVSLMPFAESLFKIGRYTDSKQVLESLSEFIKSEKLTHLDKLKEPIENLLEKIEEKQNSIRISRR